jgi:cytochrome c oxidase cbb3-type subunit IV
MDTRTFLHIIMTVITFITFVGIVFWAYSRKRKPEFEAAANAPFALPDDAEGPDTNAIAARGGRVS